MSKRTKVKTQPKKSPAKKAKKTVQRKTAKFQRPRFAKVLAKKPSVEKLSEAFIDSVHLDQMILDLAAGPYNKILKQLEIGKRRIDEERRVALLLGSRILQKARDVRDQIMTQAQKVPGVSYVTPKASQKNKSRKSKAQKSARS